MNTYQAYRSDAQMDHPNAGFSAQDHFDAVQPTHPVLIGYLFWVIGFTGAHRFYFGKPLTGALWFFTGGLLLIGWIVDLFLIPAMAEQAERRYRPNSIDYSVAWILLVFLGVFGVHRFYMGKFVTGLIYLLTGGLLGIGYVYDICTLNEQIDETEGGGF
ncbi:NINE protein [Neorhodopirellula pilleata]|uniref:TM2 domain protein n=1 Tax=Neorhodopirellula pilleata TaxID=2714738 RepID=A0A5C6A2T7_9BACT|nr:TM2 domain protein [Neorhodopirellula pilleata]